MYLLIPKTVVSLLPQRIVKKTSSYLEFQTIEILSIWYSKHFFAISNLTFWYEEIQAFLGINEQVCQVVSNSFDTR
jgi:hypothetical protein